MCFRWLERRSQFLLKCSCFDKSRLSRGESQGNLKNRSKVDKKWADSKMSCKSEACEMILKILE